MQFWRAYRRYFLYAALSLCLLAAAVVAWLATPPRVVRLLPDGSTVLYGDFGTVRRLVSLKGQPTNQLESDYAQFVRQTGIDYEQDLDAIALSIDASAPGDGKVTGVAQARYNRSRLIAWLTQHGAKNIPYRGVDCYQMPVETRTLKIALLDSKTIAFSNLEDSGAFYATIDRKLRWTTLGRAPSLVSEHYRQLPIGALFWSITSMPGAANAPQAPAAHSLLEQFLPLQPDAPSTLLFSLRSFKNVEARADFLFSGEPEATDFAEKTHTYLQIFRTIEKMLKLKGGDKDVQALFSSIAVEQKGSRTRLSASIPNALLRKVVNGAKQQYGAPPTSAEPSQPAQQPQTSTQPSSAANADNPPQAATPAATQTTPATAPNGQRQAPTTPSKTPPGR